jgi:L-alanine-DL-glutamate epimerase-like enolase superfamily enzyme
MIPSMIQTSLQVEIKTLKLAEPFRIAHGTSSERQVLRLHWRGAVGEAPFVPYYPDQPGETLRWLERTQWNGGSVPREGPKAGRLALDLLWHDAIGKERRQPLWQMWGLKSDRPIAGCRSLGIPSDLDVFADKAREIARQFPVLKLKVGSGNPDLDEAIMQRAREAAPQATIFADANGGWTVADAVKLIPLAAKHGLSFIEQPVHHDGGVEVWRELRAALPSCPLPLYADESAQKSDDIERLAGLVDGVNVKLLKCGSIEETKLMIRFARANRMKVLLGCMIESSVGVTAAAHLAPLVDGIDLDGHFYVAHDDYQGLGYSETGNLILPTGAGIGAVKH